jgi:hypothetical protein
MMGWCMYELIYLIALSSVTSVFCVYVFYNLIRWRLSTSLKAIALHFLSVLLIGLGYLISEYYIDYNNHFRCEDREGTASIVMLISVLIIILLCVLLLRKQYVINRSVNTLLALFETLLLLWVLVFLAIPDWKSFSELVMLSFLIPIGIFDYIFELIPS